MWDNISLSVFPITPTILNNNKKEEASTLRFKSCMKCIWRSCTDFDCIALLTMSVKKCHMHVMIHNTRIYFA